MLVSLLLSCLFFGLISMILPSDKKTEWIYVLLISVLIFSVGSHLSEIKFSLPEPKEYYPEDVSALPESAALEAAVSLQVYSLTGQHPLSVESDLQRREENYELTRILVVIRSGNEKEVQDALRKTFSFQGITVVSQKDNRSGEVFHLLPEEQRNDSD